MSAWCGWALAAIWRVPNGNRRTRSLPGCDFADRDRSFFVRSSCEAQISRPWLDLESCASREVTTSRLSALSRGTCSVVGCRRRGWGGDPAKRDYEGRKKGRAGSTSPLRRLLVPSEAPHVEEGT